MLTSKSIATVCLFLLVSAAFAVSAQVPAENRATGPVGPVTNAPEITPAKRALIMQMLEITNAKAMSTSVFDSMWTQTMALADSMYERKIENNPTYSEEQKVAARESYRASQGKLMERAKEYLKEHFNFDEFVVTSSLAMYDKYFTEAELQDLVNFYGSPTGQKMVQTMPQMMQEVLAASFERTNTIMPGYERYMNELIEGQLAELTELIKPIAPANPHRAPRAKSNRRTN
jgi:hypothetical protein